jgi:predicted nuclease of predicted toxin-antitoxin system
MKVLLDECVPWPMHRILVGYDCTSTQWRGWGGIKNGELIQLAENEFDIFVTSDQNLRYQQNLNNRRMAIVELSTNDLRQIIAASEMIMDALGTVSIGEYRKLEIS